jgi:hypothetical protein
MTKFEDLSGNIQALILAKLAMELNTRGSVSLYDLAKRRHTDLNGVWDRFAARRDSQCAQFR